MVVELKLKVPAGYRGFLYPRSPGDPSSIDLERYWYWPPVTAHRTTTDNRTLHLDSMS